MADTKISALTALAGSAVEQLADVIPIVDTSVTTTKKILVSELAQAMLVLGTPQATTSGTSKDFSSIPAWVKRITISFDGVSTNGTSEVLIQIGDSGGLEVLSYTGSSMGSSAGGNASSNYTTGFGIRAGLAAGTVRYGTVVLTLVNSSTNLWVATGVINSTDGTSSTTGGSRALDSALDRLRITTVNGTDAFDAGSVNILLE